ncbi:hypothetical protein [Paucibacter sp. Y2R2-4]|uniref:hypothetical protein n=1 Tax=Paucibacter sp. Y2R2-4 TaxID=2893553 RepID=UPI0021E4C4C0|nr:hypothetical protein [Paucibacter sp. Y2R2-4]MCV2349712.1 hypothetical protein [Paucibacter sp. Y2R2-4]
MQRKLKSRSDVKAQSAVLKLKKRHVETVTRLPTKRMATACWAFIVAKRPELETAPGLETPALRLANIKVTNNLSTAPTEQLVDEKASRKSPWFATSRCNKPRLLAIDSIRASEQ